MEDVQFYQFLSDSNKFDMVFLRVVGVFVILRSIFIYFKKKSFQIMNVCIHVAFMMYLIYYIADFYISNHIPLFVWKLEVWIPLLLVLVVIGLVFHQMILIIKKNRLK